MFFKKHMARMGFTLIELLLVIAIIAIVAVTVMPKWTATTTNTAFDANRVLNDIRYTQALSLTTGQRYRWVRVSSTSYQITNEAGTAIILPNGLTQITLASGISFASFTNLPNNLIAFDAQGTPYTDASIPGTALAAAAIVPVTGGGLTQSIQITPQTGYGILP